MGEGKDEKEKGNERDNVWLREMDEKERGGRKREGEMEMDEKERRWMRKKERGWAQADT